MKQKSVNKSHTGRLPGLWNHSFNKCLKCYCYKVEQSPFSKRLPQQGKPLGKCQPRAIYFKYFHSHRKRLFLFQTSVVFCKYFSHFSKFFNYTAHTEFCSVLENETFDHASPRNYPLPVLLLFVLFVVCLFRPASASPVL